MGCIIWQDLLMMVTGTGFLGALLPTIFSRTEVPKGTSISTAVLLLLNCVALASLSLWLAFSTTLLTAAAWILISLGGLPVWVQRKR